ncbi:hypothetical protein KM043_000757 [Ampulex compressa]|nr:hypothetical protein KM043_000757 [Ampulex compressa]
MDVTLPSLLLFLVALICIYLRNCYSYWSKRGVPCAKGLIPPLGHMLPVVTMRTNLGNLCKEMYKNHKNVSMVGFYNMKTPVLLLREPNLVKTVLQTQFTNFHENQLKINPKYDPLLAKNPFFSYGEPWQRSRKRFTYAFSSMRLKIIFETVKVVCAKFEKYLESHVRPGEKYEVELKELFSKFTAEVVANAALGIEGYCFDDDKKSESFVWIGKSFLQPNLKSALIHILNLYLPGVNKIVGQSFLPKNVDMFFRNAVRDILTSRATEQTRRNDFFQLMTDLEKAEGEKLDEESLTAHVLSFFLDGYETSSITLSFLAFLLASYPDTQETLREEIRSVLAKDGGALSYENLKEMTYMDKAMSESQRLYPAMKAAMATLMKSYKLEVSTRMKLPLKLSSKYFMTAAEDGLQKVEAAAGGSGRRKEEGEGKRPDTPGTRVSSRSMIYLIALREASIIPPPSCRQLFTSPMCSAGKIEVPEEGSTGTGLAESLVHLGSRPSAHLILLLLQARGTVERP